MAAKIFSFDVDLELNSLLRAKLYPLSTTDRLALSLDSDDEGLAVYDTTEHVPYYWTGTVWKIGGKQDFLALDDTPNSYAGAALQVLRVNSGQTAIEFHALVKADVGLGNVDNTSDVNKPVSTAQQAALDLKADKATTITATGNGITGGGDLSINRTISLDFAYLDGRYAASGSGVLSFNGRTGVVTPQLGDYTTSIVAEGSNLYYTDARVLAYGDTQWVQLDGSYSNPSWIASLPWSKITATPTTIADYGITDAYTKVESDNRFVNVTGDTISGPILFNSMPIGGTELVNKAYVDNMIYSLSWKYSSRASTTGALPTYSVSGDFLTLTATTNGALPAQDGVTLIVGDRLLVKNEPVGSLRANNGIYQVTSLGSAGSPWILTRVSDADSGSELEVATTLVRQGATEANRAYSVNVSPITLGTTQITFALVAGAGTYVNGTGILLSGNIFSLDTTYTNTLYQAKFAGTGYVKSTAGVVSYVTAIPNSDLANSTISGISLGSNLANLSISAELISGGATTYNGSTAKSIGIQAGSVTNTMLTNSTISGIALGSTLGVLTFNNGGAGDASGITYTGATARTISYNTLGAVPATRTLNTLALSADQTFAVGTSGSNFNISSSGTIHTFNIPDASGSNRGLVTTGVQSFGGQKTFTSVRAGSVSQIGLSLDPAMTASNIGVYGSAGVGITWVALSSGAPAGGGSAKGPQIISTTDGNGWNEGLIITTNNGTGDPTQTTRITIPGGAFTYAGVTIDKLNVSTTLVVSSTITGQLVNAITFDNSGVGVASGTTYNNTSARTISYNTIGAAPLSGSGNYIQNQFASAQATSNFWISANGRADGYLRATGGFGAGTTPSISNGVSFSGTIAMTGGTTVAGVGSVGTIQSDVTTSGLYFGTFAQTAVASFTLTSLKHYMANQGTFGAGSTVTNQYGFTVENSLTGATNNYGFYGNIPVGTGRWNLYMAGGAANYINGNLQLGSTTAMSTADKLQITGTLRLDTSASNAASGIILNQGTGGSNTNSGRLFLTNDGDFTTGSFSIYKASTFLSFNYGANPNSSSGTQGFSMSSAGDVNFQKWIVIAGNGTVTASQAALSITQAWNNAAVTFVAADTNITDTASASDSILQRWRVNSAVKATILKDGSIGAYGSSHVFGDTTLGFGLTLRGAAGTTRDIAVQSGTTTVWTVRLANATAQSGSNAGSDFEILNRTDAGVLIGTPFSITRATGLVTIPTLSVTTLSGTATTQFIQNQIASAQTTANFWISGQGRTDSYFRAAVGLGINATVGSTQAINIAKTITGGVSGRTINASPTIASDVTTDAYNYESGMFTQAASFTLPNFVHYIVSTNSVGAGSTVTNQAGFVVSSGMTGATNNYGFRGQLAASTGRWNLYMDGTASNYLEGGLVIGSTSLSSANLKISRNISGNTTVHAILLDGAVQSGVTTTANGYLSTMSTAASAFTLNEMNHFIVGANTIGAGSTLTTQFGFRVTSNMTGATSNYGIASELAVGTGRWNLYMSGSANNYIQGALGLGTNAPTHAFTLASGGTSSIAHYNTSDQTTNYERARQFWTSNTYTIQSESGGTGTTRDIVIQTNTPRSLRIGDNVNLGFIEVSTGTSSSNRGAFSVISGISGSSGIQYGATIALNVTQSSTAGYKGLYITSYESSTGSGTKLLIDAGTNSATTGSGTHTSKWSVSNVGNSVQTGTITATLASASTANVVYYNTSTGLFTYGAAPGGGVTGSGTTGTIPIWSSSSALSNSTLSDNGSYLVTTGQGLQVNSSAEAFIMLNRTSTSTRAGIYYQTANSDKWFSGTMSPYGEDWKLWNFGLATHAISVDINSNDVYFGNSINAASAYLGASVGATSAIFGSGGYGGFVLEATGSTSGDILHVNNTSSGRAIYVDSGDCYFGSGVYAGTLSKGSGSFKIDHPLESMEDTHYLVHSFVEGPKADLIYRGKIQLVNGVAIVNIDEAAGMTQGTFEALCQDVQCFTTNEDSWDAVKGSVSGNILTIRSQNPDNITVSWIVIGERKDKHMLNTKWTDAQGHVIVEPKKNPKP
jgi:hypothetical protein